MDQRSCFDRLEKFFAAEELREKLERESNQTAPNASAPAEAPVAITDAANIIQVDSDSEGEDGPIPEFVPPKQTAPNAPAPAEAPVALTDAANIIQVDSDSDGEDGPIPEFVPPADAFDPDNPDVSVKVRWKGDVLRFSVRRHQKLTEVYKSLAERENAPIEHVVLTLPDSILSPDDTPASIDYKIYNFIEGRIMVRSSSTAAKPTTKKDPTKLKFKIQSNRWKRPMHIEIEKTDKLKLLFIKCGEEINVPYRKIKLRFDGEVLDPNASPSDFELEGGEVIDLIIKE